MMGNAIKNKTISNNQPTNDETKIRSRVGTEMIYCFFHPILKNGGQTTTLSVGLNSYIN